MDMEFNVLDLIKIMLKKWWIIVIFMVVTGGAVFVYFENFVEPVYLSKGMLYVNNANSKVGANNNVNLNDLNASQRMATTYIEILKSDSFMSTISKNSGVNYSPSKLRSMISIMSKNKTEILDIGVFNTDPQIAATIVSTILDCSKNELARVFKGGSVEILDHPTVPTVPFSPNVMKNTIMGIILGIMLGALVVFIINFFDTRVKGYEDLMDKYNYSVLGLIPSFHSKNTTYGGYTQV